jgi:exodeoxyribonuclease V beta subunit
MNDTVDELDVYSCPLDGIRLVEASAGTGKTWNLCGLVLRLLLERRLPLQQILVVTYTNAAAAELRERIRQRLSATLAHLRGAGTPSGDPFVPRLVDTLRQRGLADDDMADRLAMALASFDEASIFTIHAFCHRALADAPFTALMPMDVELLHDDSELVQAAANDLWRRRVAGGTIAPTLAGWLARQGDTPERWAALLKRQQAKPTARRLWPLAIDDRTLPDTAALAAAHDAARTLWHAEPAAIVQRVHAGLPDVLNNASYKPAFIDTAADSWDTLLGHADPLDALDTEPERLSLFGRLQLQTKTKKGKATPVHAFFDAAQAVLDTRAAFALANELARLRLLRELLDEGGAELRLEKQARRVLSFDDLLSQLHQRLTGPGAAALRTGLRARFPAALIDEFQDTDPLQWAIFDALYGAGERTLFLIGDPKQAIYGFRNADLHTYLQARARADGEYTLLDNQRSVGPLLGALNRVFGAHPAAFMQEGLVFRPVGFGAKPRSVLVDRSGAPAALTVWELPPDPDTGAPLAQARAAAFVHQAVAGEVARLLEAARAGDITLDGRPLRAGDIAVLVRSHADGGATRQAMAAVGVGSVELAQASVFHSGEAEDIERLLAAVLEPTRIGLVKAALASVAMGWDASAIDALASDESALLGVMQRLTGYQQAWLQRGVGVMLRQWLAEEQVAGRLLARDDGERRLTNLLHLAELLHQAAADHGAPDALQRWLQAQRREPRADEAAQLRLESDQNLVQIVTIHKSKGLEFPIVFCPSLWKGRVASGHDGLPGVEYHDDAGQAVLDFRKGFEGEFDDKEVAARRRLAAAAEWLRLAYVALTRAVHRCVLVQGTYGSGRGGQSTTASTHGLLHWLVAGSGLSPKGWFDHKLLPATIAAAWHDLAAASEGGLAVVPLPLLPGTRLQPDADGPGGFAALAPPARMPAAWWMGSYSGLVHRLDADRHAGQAADHDLRIAAGAEPPGAPPAERAADHAAGRTDNPGAERSAHPSTGDEAADDDDILCFPRGAAAGVCLHTVFEHADFVDSGTWPAAIRRGLQGLAPALAAVPAETPQARMLSRVLADVLATPLPVGTARPWLLTELSGQRRLNELEFHLPAGSLDAATLNRWLADHGYPVPTLAFGTLGGFFKGVIDLIAEHDGRWFIIDWKSNHLGHRPADYAQPALAAAMAEHAYHLQYLLYAVALDRFLRWRLPGYVPGQHFGGVLYLFVRGVRPGWRDEHGQPTGVFFHRPAPQIIESLSAFFAPAGAAA